MKLLLALATSLTLCACGSPVSSASTLTHDAAQSASALSKPGVRWFGALHAIMHEGRTQSAVTLQEIVPGPHAWGLGALQGLRGELTILDDVVWIALPQADGTASLRKADVAGADRIQGAALLVVANVQHWDEEQLAEDVAFAQLEHFLAGVLRRRGATLEAPIALRVEGPVRGLHWHVVDGSKLTKGARHAEHARTAVSGVRDAEWAQLVGFYSTQHQGVFTHAGSQSHFHVVVANVISGHVDAVDLVKGARLLIARQ